MTSPARILMIAVAMATLFAAAPVFAVGGNTAQPFYIVFRCPIADANGESTCVPKLQEGSLVIQHVQIRTISRGDAHGVVRFTSNSSARTVYVPTIAIYADGQTYLERNAPLYLSSLTSIIVYGASPNSEVYLEITGVRMI